jgi:hypothetical protein
MFINNSFVLNKAKHYLEKQPNVLARTRQKIPPSGKRETRRNKKKEKSNEFITKIRKRKCQKGGKITEQSEIQLLAMRKMME